MNSADISLSIPIYTRIQGNIDSINKDEGENGYWVDTLEYQPYLTISLILLLNFSLYLDVNSCSHLLTVERQHVSQLRVCTLEPDCLCFIISSAHYQMFDINLPVPPFSFL